MIKLGFSGGSMGQKKNFKSMSLMWKAKYKNGTMGEWRDDVYD